MVAALDERLAKRDAIYQRRHPLHPTPYTLHPTPYTLHPSPYTLALSLAKLRIVGLESEDAVLAKTWFLGF